MDQDGREARNLLQLKHSLVNVLEALLVSLVKLSPRAYANPVGASGDTCLLRHFDRTKLIFESKADEG